jgi:cbb3-type cytochrome oxidase subunit 3
VIIIAILLILGIAYMKKRRKKSERAYLAKYDNLVPDDETHTIRWSKKQLTK